MYSVTIYLPQPAGHSGSIGNPSDDCKVANYQIPERTHTLGREKRETSQVIGGISRMAVLLERGGGGVIIYAEWGGGQKTIKLWDTETNTNGEGIRRPISQQKKN